MDAKLLKVLSIDGESVVIAVKLAAGTEEEQEIVAARNFQIEGGKQVMVITLRPRPISATYDPFDWRNGDMGVAADWPMFWAHKQIETNWDDLASGDVIDIRDAPNPHE
jgi:hypothetical protein